MVKQTNKKLYPCFSFPWQNAALETFVCKFQFATIKVAFNAGPEYIVGIKKLLGFIRLYSIVMICKFPICEFTYLLKCICNLKMNTQGALRSFLDMHRAVKNLNHLTHTFLAEIKQRAALPSCFSSHTTNKCPLVVCLEPCFPHFWGFCWRCCCLKRPPSTVLKCCLAFLNSRRLWRALWRKHMWDELHLGMSYSAAGCEFGVQESIAYVKQMVFKQKYTQNEIVYWSVDVIYMSRSCRNLTLYFF